MQPVIGMILPPASGEVPAEAHGLAPEGVRFAGRGLALGELTIEGYSAVIGRARELAIELRDQERADAIALMGTSLSFFRGAEFNDELVRTIEEATGLPATTMSNAICDALTAVGSRRLAVGTAYVEEVNERLARFLRIRGFKVLSLESLGLSEIPAIHGIGEDQVVDLGKRAFETSGAKADAVLISCGGLKSLNLAPRLEAATGVPVIASATAGVWAALRLVGIECRNPLLGRLAGLEDAAA
jgi:arylmalonate decarboxylase